MVKLVRDLFFSKSCIGFFVLMWSCFGGRLMW